MKNYTLADAITRSYIYICDVQGARQVEYHEFHFSPARAKIVISATIRIWGYLLQLRLFMYFSDKTQAPANQINIIQSGWPHQSSFTHFCGFIAQQFLI